MNEAFGVSHVWLRCLTCTQLVQHRISVRVVQSASGVVADPAEVESDHTCPNL